MEWPLKATDALAHCLLSSSLHVNSCSIISEGLQFDLFTKLCAFSGSHTLFIVLAQLASAKEVSLKKEYFKANEVLILFSTIHGIRL